MGTMGGANDCITEEQTAAWVEVYRMSQDGAADNADPAVAAEIDRGLESRLQQKYELTPMEASYLKPGAEAELQSALGELQGLMDELNSSTQEFNPEAVEGKLESCLQGLPASLQKIAMEKVKGDIEPEVERSTGD